MYEDQSRIPFNRRFGSNSRLLYVLHVVPPLFFERFVKMS